MTNMEIYEYYWSRIRIPLYLSDYIVSKKTLKWAYRVTLKQLNSSFKLSRFEVTSKDITNVITFKDGFYEGENECAILWTLPWFNYKILIEPSTQPSSDNISSIVENSLILMILNGYNTKSCLMKPNCYDNIMGYEPINLVWFMRHLLAVCCFFYSKHKINQEVNVTIDQFMRLCAINFLQRLEDKDIDIAKQELFNKVKERNTINFRSKYGKGKRTPVTVTMGNLDRASKHSLSMTKYGDDVLKEINNLYPEHSTREIAKILNDKGIGITKSTVDRRIQMLKPIQAEIDAWNDYYLNNSLLFSS